jgi:hypothetical protein
MMDDDSALSPLKSLTLCLHEVGYNIPSDAIAFCLFRGIATDNPPGLADLQSLKLCVGGLSERSMTALQRVLRKPSTVLSKLDLTNGDLWIDDSIVEKICRSVACNATGTRLSILHLGGNRIGNAGVQHLASILKDNTMLTELHLGSNEIGNKGVVALANVLAVHNRTLKLLDLDQNQIGDAGMTAMVRAILDSSSSLTHLSIHKNPPVTHVSEKFLVESVAEMHGLKSLRFGPIRTTGNLKRFVTAMESNHTLVDIFYDFSDDALLEPDELDDIHPHMRLSSSFGLVCMGLCMRKMYPTISDIKIEMMAKYIPYIFLLCQMNKRIRPLLSPPEDSVPLGLWPHIMTKKVPDVTYGLEFLPSDAIFRVRMSDAIFCLLREEPGLFVPTCA